MPGAPLSLPERDEIARALIENPTVAWAVIGRIVERHPTTIACEVLGHGGRDRYRPATAHRCAERARSRCRHCVLETPGPLRERVTAELRLGRSPYAIHADLSVEAAEAVCVETIYASVCAGVLDVSARDCLRMRRPRRRGRQARHPNRRPVLANISQRSPAVGDRSELGHWEADQIIGKANRSAMLCLTELVTRYSILVTMPEGYSAEAMVAGLVDGLDRVPAHLLRSITFDQGSEWADWAIIANNYKIKVWFCDPHSPWQRGQIENLNRQWRWWFPRGTDLAGITPAAADHAATIINGQHRRLLDHHSPAALYAVATVQ